MKVHHIGYLVKNLKKSEAQFTSMVGGYSIEQEALYDEYRKVTISFLVNGDYRIELVEPTKDSPMYGLLKKFKNSPYHICYEVDDLETTVKILEEQNCLVIQEPLIAPCINGGKQRVVFMGTPAMGLIELLETTHA